GVALAAGHGGRHGGHRRGARAQLVGGNLGDQRRVGAAGEGHQRGAVAAHDLAQPGQPGVALVRQLHSDFIAPPSRGCPARFSATMWVRPPSLRTSSTAWPSAASERGTLVAAGGWSTVMVSRAPSGNSSRRSLARRNVYGQTSPERSRTSVTRRPP